MLNILFTRKALAIYLEMQDRIAREHYAEWLADAAKDPRPKTIMHTVRHMNMHTSLRVFCGNHIARNAIFKISDEYWKITKALELVNFPLAIPGTKVWGAIQSRKAAMRFLEDACAKSKEYVAAGGEVHCMIDAWVKDVLDAKAKAATEGSKAPREFSNREMALVVLSFLFASQDAMSSGVIFMFQHLADHPEILVKVREEQNRVRAGNYQSPVTLEMIDNMPYLRAVIKESLRLKPPVTMVDSCSVRIDPLTDPFIVGTV